MLHYKGRNLVKICLTLILYTLFKIIILNGTTFVSCKMSSDVCETHNSLIYGWDPTRLDFLQPIIPTLIEDCLQHGIGPNGQGFSGWALKASSSWPGN
jgi:hypothetical protein